MRVGSDLTRSCKEWEDELLVVSLADFGGQLVNPASGVASWRNKKKNCSRRRQKDLTSGRRRVSLV